MKKVLEFDNNNQLAISSDELLAFIDEENKVTVILEKGFDKKSDTEDVFRSLVGDVAFEESDEFVDALELEGEVRHTFFLSNASKETPFNERGMVKRLIKDNYWTKLLLHDHPLMNGFYAVIKNVGKNA